MTMPSLLDLPRVDPPSVPVRSSERGADRARKFASTQCDAIILALGAAGCMPGSGKYLSRDQIIAAIPGLSVNAACGRLAPSGPLLVPKDGVPKRGRGPWTVVAVEDAAISNDGGRVVGYQLSNAGRERCQR